MNRKTALAAAGATALVVVAGAVAVGANLGILGLGKTEKAGFLSPVSGDVQEQVPAPTVTIYRDETTAPAAGENVSTPAAETPSPRETVVETVVVNDPPATTGPTMSGHESEGSDDGSGAASPEPSHSEEPSDD